MSNSLPINHIPLLSNFYALTATQPVMINPTPATTQFAVPQIVTEIADIDAEKMMDNADWGTEGRVPGDEKLLLLVAACQDKAEEYQREQHKKQSAIDISARVGAVEKKSISPPASVVNEKLWEINGEHLRWHFQKTASLPLNLLDQDVNMPVVAFSDSEHICEEDIKDVPAADIIINDEDEVQTAMDTPAILIIDDENSVQITQGNLESEHMLDIVSSSSENESREDSQDTPASEIIEDQVQTAAEEKPALSPAQQRRLSYLHKKIARTVEKMKVPGITEREFGHHQKRVDRWDAEALKLKFSTSTTENAGKNWCIKKSSGRKAQKYTQLSGVHLQYPTIVFTFKNKKRGATTTQASGTASVAKKDRGNEGKFVVTASDSFTTHHVKKVTTSPTIEINEGELTDNDSGPVEKPKPLTRVQLAKIHTLQKLRGPLRRSAEPDEEDSDSSSDIMSPKPAPTTPNIPKVYVELPAVDNPSRDPSLEPVPIFPTPASKRRSGKVSRKSTKTTQRFEPYGGRNKKSRPVLPVTPMSVPSKDSSEEPEPAERQSLSLPRGIGIFLVTKNTTVQASTNCSDSTASNINLLEIYRRTKRKSTPISYWENLKENQQHVTFKTNWFQGKDGVLVDTTNQANTTPGELKRKFIDDDQDDASYKRAMTVNPRSRFYGVPQNSLLTAVLTRENYAEQPEPVKEKKARKSNVRSKKVSTKTVATASVRCSTRFTNNANSHTAGEIAA